MGERRFEPLLPLPKKCQSEEGPGVEIPECQGRRGKRVFFEGVATISQKNWVQNTNRPKPKDEKTKK